MHGYMLVYKYIYKRQKKGQISFLKSFLVSKNYDENIYGWRRILLNKLKASWNFSSIIIASSMKYILSFWLIFLSYHRPIFIFFFVLSMFFYVNNHIYIFCF